MRDSPQIPPQASQPSASTDLKRRRFLLAMSAGGAGAVAAASPARAATVAGEAAPESGDSPGYRESAHVKRYYASTRI